MPCLLIAPDAEHAAQMAAIQIDEMITAYRRDADVVHIALAGGSTPRHAYAMLAARRQDWSGVHLWFGDERVVPLDSDDANARMVDEALVRPAGISDVQIHRVPTQLGPAGACIAYADELHRLLPLDAAGLPILDIAVLGLGEDGHTASLFPGSDALHGTDRICAVVENSPKPPPVRITLTMAMLNAARARIMLTAGTGKAAAVAAALADPDERVPASLLARQATTWILDEAAAQRARGERAAAPNGE